MALGLINHVSSFEGYRPAKIDADVFADGVPSQWKSNVADIGPRWDVRVRDAAGDRHFSAGLPNEWATRDRDIRQVRPGRVIARSGMRSVHRCRRMHNEVPTPPHVVQDPGVFLWAFGSNQELICQAAHQPGYLGRFRRQEAPQHRLSRTPRDRRSQCLRR